jgi:hypothetical protein
MTSRVWLITGTTSGTLHTIMFFLGRLYLATISTLHTDFILRNPFRIMKVDFASLAFHPMQEHLPASDAAWSVRFCREVIV